MIRMVRGTVVREGNMSQFIPWAKKAVEYHNAHWPEAKAQIFWQRFVVPEVACYYVIDTADLAALDRVLEAAGSDEGYAKLMGEAPAVFVEDADYIEVLQSV